MSAEKNPSSELLSGSRPDIDAVSSGDMRSGDVPPERASSSALVLAVSGMDEMDDVRNDSEVGDADRGDTPLSCCPSTDDVDN